MKHFFGLSFLFIIFFYGSTSHARLFLDVSVLNKKGIDIGLTLGSEVHSREEVRATEDINISMKSGLSVLLRASFEDKVESGIPTEALPEATSKGSIQDGTVTKITKFINITKLPKESKESKKSNESKEGETSQQLKQGDRPTRVIGPSSKVVIRGRIIGTDGLIIKDFFENPLIVTLGEVATITHSKNSQLVEIKIKPHIE